MLKIHLRGSKSVSSGLLGGVGEVDHDAEAVHLLNHRLQSKVIIIFNVTIFTNIISTTTIIPSTTTTTRTLPKAVSPLCCGIAPGRSALLQSALRRTSCTL